MTWLWACGYVPDDRETSAWGSILHLEPIPGSSGPAPAQASPGDPGTFVLDFDALEVWEDAGGVQVPVERRGGTRGAVSVRFQSFNPDVRWGRAEPELDFLSVSGVLSWGDGDAATKYFVVPVLEDTEVEDLEGFTVFLSHPMGGAQVYDWGSWVSILDDELRLTPGTLDFVGPREIEVAEGAGAVELAVRRTGGMGGRVSVRYRIEAGTAQAGSDFRGSTGVLVWGDSDLAPRVIRVPIRNDRAAEPEEYFRVELSDPAGGVHLPDGSAVSVDIRDDDAPSGGAAEK